MYSSSSALLLVDVQRSFFYSPYWQSDHFPAFKRNLRSLLDAARNVGIPLVRILHSEPNSNGPFDPESGHVVAMEEFEDAADRLIYKHAHNAFTGTALETWLREKGINHLYICGIRTEQCCETTTRVASDLGFTVSFVLDATLTFDMSVPGIDLSAKEIIERTAVVLDGRFAEVTSVESCLNKWRQ